MSPVMVGVLGYVCAQLAVGVWVARRVATEDDYLVAGRRLGLPLAAFSVFATWFGAETCVSSAAQAHAEGLSEHAVEPFAYGICLLLAGLLFAAPLWRRRITTLADLFRTRYSPAAEAVAAVVLIPASVLWAAAQIRAFGHVLASMSSVDFESAIAVAALLAVGYTVLGGLLADVVTDLIQGIALMVGLVLIAGGVGDALGGVGGALAATARAEVHWVGSSWLATAEAWALPICGSVVAQEVVSRSVAARSAATARNAGLLGGALYLAVGVIPFWVGLVGAEVVPEVGEAEQLLAAVARQVLPALPFVLFAGALVSAILSTVDSALLSAASFASRNLLLAGRDAGQRRRLVTARAAVAVFGLAAWWLAHTADSVFALIEDASGFGSAGVLVCVAAGLFTRAGGPRAALGSLTCGVGSWVALAYLVPFDYPYLASLAAALAGFGLGALADRRSAESRR